MAANPTMDFDLGPLTWVKTEIDHSLNQAREHLDKLAAAPSDRAPVKYILTHLHQATGALAMVGLAAATRCNEELEKLVAFLEGEDAARLPAAIATAKRGISALSAYLDTLLAGQADHPMRLLAPYLELNRARGANDANEGDLFFPDLATALPGAAAPAGLDDAVLGKALAHQRSQYQQGLLKMLKGGDTSDAMRQMHAAVTAIESLQGGTGNRAFWVAASAFFDALVFGGIEVTPGVKPLFARLDQQIKQLIDGAGKVPERVFRDLLLAVGRARAVADRITLLKQAYRLEQLLALPDAARGADDEALVALVRELRELTAQQKDTWLKYTSGNRAALEPFAKQAMVVADRSAKLPNRDFHAVMVRLSDVAPALKARAIPPSDAQALEIATALLFIESALENYFRVGPDFARQARTVADRLKSALAGDALPPMESIEGGLLDQMTRRAQEKLLIFQVGQEVQVNLQNIEQVLDGFFREPSRRAELAALAGQFAQVQGALMIMELNEAASLNAAVMARVQQFAEGSVDGSGEAADMVADGLSALGLYINALQQGSMGARDALVPALVRFGIIERPLPDDEVRGAGTVTPLDIEVQKQKVQALYEDWKEKPEDGTRERLERAVGDLKRDATVVADSAVANQSEAALQAIQGGGAPDQSGVFSAIQAIAPDNAPESPTSQVVQLVDAPGAEIDRELLEIFLEEATEVIGTIGLNTDACRDSPHDREALTTIRRGFHTLKGSGRMVGLTDLGEMAWQCEQVLNKWLKEEKPASAPLLDFVRLAHESFLSWVEALKRSSAAPIDGAEITRRAELLKSDQPVEAAPSAPAQEAPAEVEAPVVAEAPAPQEAEPVVAEEMPALDFASPAPAMAALELVDEAALKPEPAPEPLQPAEARAAPPAPAFEFESLDLEPQRPAVQQAPAPAEEEGSLDFALEEAAALPAELQYPEPSLEEADVVVGAVTLSATFFNIYLGEAEEHVATLDREMCRIESDPMEPVSADFMRAAHTLASTSRTTGFQTVADVASELEKWLTESIELPPEFDPQRIAATRGAVDALTAMVQSIRGRAAPYPRDDIVESIAALREGLREARRTGEGTHIRMPGAVRDALEVTRAEEMLQAEPRAAEPEAPVPEQAAPQQPAPVFELSPSVPQAPAAIVESEPAVEEMPAIEAAPAEALSFDVDVPAAAEPLTPAQGAVELEPQELLPPAFEPAPVEPAAAATPAPQPQPAVEPEPAAAPAAAAPAAPELPLESRPFEAGKDQRKIKDDVDRDLLPIFLDEARELIPLVSEGVRRWKARPADHSFAADLQRHLHTLKGSARMTGLMRLGELAHVLETRLNAIDGIETPPAREFEEIEERVDRFSSSLERLARGEDILEAEPIHVSPAAVFEHQKDKPTAMAVIAAAAQEKAERDALPPELREGRAALLRVNAEMIDRFVNEAGELSIARSRIELEMVAFRRALVDLTDNIARMRSQLREIEIAAESQMQSTIKLKEESGETFDPLEFDRFSRTQELTRFLAESLGDVITLHQGLQKNLDETELALHAQARLNRDLQQGLMGVRLVPFGNLADRFYRIVRQTAKDLDKKANLELKGTRTELDRSVLEKITAPFEHLLRNAIAHGLEKPGERAARGKTEIGEIAIESVQRGNEVVLTVSDDGGGLDFPRIREKAIQAGLLAPDVELPEAQLAQFIFVSGFSTATEVSQIAGRGVGMDVVKNEITSLGGRIEIASAAGRGTTFTITLPLTLAVTQAVMLRAGPTIYAVPSVMIEQVIEYKAAQYTELAAKGEIEWKANRYALRSLLPLLGEIDTATPARQIPVLLLKSGLQRAAIRVDDIIGNREVVVKTIGPQLARLSGVAGATVLGNGQVVLILNPVQLVHREQPAFEVPRALPTPQEAPLVVEAKSGAALIMVVDDSLTVRKITGRMLTREGYEVATAKDGVDALQQLQDVKPDCILLDVEMPRMDGFEFARNVRADAGTRGIPIIMITSRTADKHRNHALEIGVNEYMGKPYQEDQLLALIRRYTRETMPA